MALLLREALERQAPGWARRALQRRALRKEAAYADHYKSRNILPPLRKEMRQ